jgi:Ecdysteroid kinase-like family
VPLQSVRIETPGDLTAEWLTAALGAPVVDFSAQRIGTGQMSECYRVTLSYADGAHAGPASVVLKVAAGDPTSRQTGLALGLYEREVRFYTDIAPRLSGPIAGCHHAAIDTETGIFDLLLDDAAPAEVGDEIRGATVEQALLAATELGRVHGSARAAGDLTDVGWLDRADPPVTGELLGHLYAAFTDRYAEVMTEQQRTVCDRLVASFEDWLATEAQGPLGLVHGDYRLDNMLFGQAGAARSLTVVDWQTVTRGPAFTDLAYFVGCALDPDVRRATIDAVVEAYLAGVGAEAGLTAADVREGVRRQSFFGVMMAIVSSMLVVQTERGDQMFMTMLTRHCEQVLDTDALEVLPA